MSAARGLLSFFRKHCAPAISHGLGGLSAISSTADFLCTPQATLDHDGKQPGTTYLRSYNGKKQKNKESPHAAYLSWGLSACFRGRGQDRTKKYKSQLHVIAVVEDGVELVDDVLRGGSKAVVEKTVGDNGFVLKNGLVAAAELVVDVLVVEVDGGDDRECFPGEGAQGVEVVDAGPLVVIVDVLCKRGQGLELLVRFQHGPCDNLACEHERASRVGRSCCQDSVGGPAASAAFAVEVDGLLKQEVEDVCFEPEVVHESCLGGVAELAVFELGVHGCDENVEPERAAGAAKLEAKATESVDGQDTAVGQNNDVLGQVADDRVYLLDVIREPAVVGKVAFPRALEGRMVDLVDAGDCQRRQPAG